MNITRTLAFSSVNLNPLVSIQSSWRIDGSGPFSPACSLWLGSATATAAGSGLAASLLPLSIPTRISTLNGSGRREAFTIHHVFKGDYLLQRIRGALLPQLTCAPYAAFKPFRPDTRVGRAGNKGTREQGTEGKLAGRRCFAVDRAVDQGELTKATMMTMMQVIDNQLDKRDKMRLVMINAE